MRSIRNFPIPAPPSIHVTLPGKTFIYYEDKGMAKVIDKVEEIDDYTVRYTLKHPDMQQAVRILHGSAAGCRSPW